MSPTRRALLRAGAVVGVGAAAGCLGRASTDDPRPPTASIDVASTDDPHSVVEHDVQVFDRYAIASSPPRVRVMLRNTADEPVSVGEARTARFELATSESTTPGLILVPAGRDIETESGESTPSNGDGCWELDSEPLRTMEFRTEQIGAGEALHSTLEVWWCDPDDSFDGCFPTGEFRFGAEFGVERDGSTSEAETHEWGFTLGVTTP